MRVLVAVPCFDMLAADFAFSLARLVAHQAGDMEIFDLRASDVDWARNHAAKLAMEGGFSHLMFLDSDMHFPADTLSRLKAAGKPIVGASYVRRTEPYDLLGEKLTTWGGGGLVEVKALPTGCMLINVSVLRKLSAPLFLFEHSHEHGTRTGEDIYFCRKAREAGVKIWCDTDLTKEIGHVGVKRYTVKDGIEYIARKQMEAKNA